MQAAELLDLLTSWEVALRAERKSAATLKAYRDGVRAFVTWADERGRPPELDRPTVAAFVAALLAGGAEPSTAKSRQGAVRRFSAWLTAEGEIPVDQLLGIKPPKIDTKHVEPLTDDQIRALIKTCAPGSLYDRRDEAIVRLMVETGARAGEVARMTVSDVDIRAGVATISRGKGGRGRTVPFGPQTTRAIDRYLRARRGHRLAATDTLWLGDHGLEFGYSALWKSLNRRASRAGISGFHPHQLRHTAAHRWLAAGGSEGGLMAVAGWTSPGMLARYTRAQASARAAAEARRLDLGAAF